MVQRPQIPVYSLAVKDAAVPLVALAVVVRGARTATENAEFGLCILKKKKHVLVVPSG